MSDPFTDIRITGLDTTATRPSEQGPAMRLLHLSLSAPPPPNWVRLFSQTRQKARHSMWRRAWIEGAHIVLDCVPEELEHYHLTDLKDDVRSCNAKYRRWDEEMAAAAAAKHRAELEDRVRLQKLAARLDFD